MAQTLQSPGKPILTKMKFLSWAGRLLRQAKSNLAQYPLRPGIAMKFDWHSDPIDRSTKIDQTYKNTQNVRRFLTDECGATFKFDRPFMAWIKSGAPKCMGEVADEWIKLHRPSI